MLKRLRLKFVCINMLLVTVMLCIIFGTVIGSTADALEAESLQMMRSAATQRMQPGPKGPRERELNLPYFVVSVNHRGEVVVQTENFPDYSDTAEVQEVLRLALAQEGESGELKDHSLRYFKTSDPFGQVIVFADTSAEEATLNALVRSCICIAVLSFGLFLFLSFLLARWAVGPVEKAWSQQRQFVADASHELKTPLTVIMTNSELLQDPGITDDARIQATDSTLTMARQMRGLVEGLLELARVDNGVVQTVFAELSLSELIEEGILPFEPLYFEKELLLASEIEPELRVRGSAAHLGQVLEILLDNAMKYSFPGEVTVTLKKQGSHALLAVRNPGPAIEGAELTNIFKRFYRLDKSRTRTGSYGLGLSIAEGIVKDHHGRIWAESREGVNTFFVQLPVV